MKNKIVKEASDDASFFMLKNIKIHIIILVFMIFLKISKIRKQFLFVCCGILDMLLQ